MLVFDQFCRWTIGTNCSVPDCFWPRPFRIITEKLILAGDLQQEACLPGEGNSCTIILSEFLLKELNKLDDLPCELQGDPNLGLPLNETVRARLKQSLASSDWGIGDIIAE